MLPHCILSRLVIWARIRRETISKKARRVDAHQAHENHFSPTSKVLPGALLQHTPCWHLAQVQIKEYAMHPSTD